MQPHYSKPQEKYSEPFIQEHELWSITADVTAYFRSKYRHNLICPVCESEELLSQIKSEEFVVEESVYNDLFEEELIWTLEMFKESSDPMSENPLDHVNLKSGNWNKKGHNIVIFLY